MRSPQPAFALDIGKESSMRSGDFQWVVLDRDRRQYDVHELLPTLP